MLILNFLCSSLRGFTVIFSRARGVLFAISSNWTSVRAALAADDLQALSLDVGHVLINLFRPQRGQQSSPEAGQDPCMFIEEGPKDEHFGI